MIKKILNRIYSKIIFIKYGTKHYISYGKHIVLSTSTSLDIEKRVKVNLGSYLFCRNNCNIKVRDGGNLFIGERVAFNDNCNLTVRESVKIGNDVLFGPNTVIIDHDHNYRSCNWKSEFSTAPIIIGNNVWIGANVVILKGSVIEDGAVVAAGSVVRGHIKKDVVYYERREALSKNISTRE